MEEGESLLDTLLDEGSVEDDQDVEMLDVEEGELIEQISKTEVGESGNVGGKQVVNQDAKRKNSRHKKKKKKNKRKRGSSNDPNVTNINRFVLDACKRLRERKSYLMWTAVGCLGVSALSDLIKEVDAIQACGGQKTADGRRFRNGGGILWNIIKARDPNAYKEIMRKGKEFEKQFKQQLHHKQEPKQQTEASSQGNTPDANQVKCNRMDGLELTSHDPSQLEPSTGGEKRASVHDRIRLPVTYDDLVGGNDPEDELA
ncbi:Mediator of U snRNA nuclear export PHAX [Handroanthus impetiginosus]|uniref:Phosphorylated adapter RNA export protein n=1 Tax=Handroanthus impetiginosus TaxID=429701 RepID=A0A2G9HH64_9LAMI|nr:Mediator of U snRNA nuclear export PHAX [Handroanthus impetiginosus]